VAQRLLISCDWVLTKGPGKGKPCGQSAEHNDSTKYVVNGKYYEADLCAEHEQEFLALLQPVLQISRTVKPPKISANTRAVLRGAGGQPFTIKDVRRWAEEQGREVPSTGRLPGALIDEYRASVTGR
jgi:hypothetical protein